MSERAGLATKTLSHEAAQRKTLWSFLSWCLSGEILLNTLLPHYGRLARFVEHRASRRGLGRMFLRLRTLSVRNQHTLYCCQTLGPLSGATPRLLARKKRGNSCKIRPELEALSFGLISLGELKKVRALIVLE